MASNVLHYTLLELFSKVECQLLLCGVIVGVYSLFVGVFIEFDVYVPAAVLSLHQSS